MRGFEGPAAEAESPWAASRLLGGERPAGIMFERWNQEKEMDN